MTAPRITADRLAEIRNMETMLLGTLKVCRQNDAVPELTIAGVTMIVAAIGDLLHGIESACGELDRFSAQGGEVPEIDRTLNESHLTKWLKVDKRWTAFVNGFHECLRRHDAVMEKVRVRPAPPHPDTVALPDFTDESTIRKAVEMGFELGAGRKPKGPDTVEVSREELSALKCIEGRARELAWDGVDLGRITLGAISELDALRAQSQPATETEKDST